MYLTHEEHGFVTQATQHLRRNYSMIAHLPDFRGWAHELVQDAAVRVYVQLLRNTGSTINPTQLSVLAKFNHAFGGDPSRYMLITRQFPRVGVGGSLNQIARVYHQASYGYGGIWTNFENEIIVSQLYTALSSPAVVTRGGFIRLVNSVRLQLSKQKISLCRCGIRSGGAGDACYVCGYIS